MQGQDETMKDVREKILLIDDDDMLLAKIALELELEGYIVVTATQAGDGLKIIQSDPPDLILLDQQMPHMTGLEFLGELRKGNDHTPVIMLTADARKEVVMMALRTGANDFHIKPYDHDFLLVSIRRELAKKKMETQLRHSVAAKQVMQERAAQMNAFSHHVRTPTHHILSFVEIAEDLLKTGKHEDLWKPLERIKMAAMAIEKLIVEAEIAA